MKTLNELFTHISKMIGRDISEVEKGQIRFRVIVYGTSFNEIIKLYEMKQPLGNIGVLEQFGIKLEE